MMKSVLYLFLRLFNPFLSNSLYSNLLFRFNSIRLKRPYYRLNINHPRTFTEKINYIKFNIRNPLSPMVSDKLAVRDYVSQKIGNEYLVPLLKVFDRPEDIDLTEIDTDCILKMNNGSGGNLIVKKDSGLTNEAVIEFFKKIFDKDIFLYSREWHYKEVKPKILVEKLISDNLNDYKFFCTAQGPFAVQVDVDRFINHKRNLYDPDWKLLPWKIRYENAADPVPRPENLEQMIEISKKLCSDFEFSRIDLYDYRGKVRFGEITLHPGGGAEPFDSRESDLEMGKFIKLNIK